MKTEEKRSREGIRWKVADQTPNPFETPQTEMIKKIAKLEDDVRRLSTLAPLFTVLNENTPAQITAAQNNYNPGDYDVLRLSTDASRTITGFAGGVKGRVLIIVVVGTNDLVLSNNNAGSAVGNRIVTGTGANVTLSAAETIILYYDSTAAVWRPLSIHS
jgi:hypothetical protein